MAELIIPDSRFEMPSLFYPNRKPVGKVKIDWGHPLARGLSAYLVVQNGVLVDLVNGLSPESTAVNVPKLRGESVDLTAANAYIDYPQGIISDPKSALTYTSNVDTKADLSGHYLLDGTAGNTESYRVFWENTSAPRFRIFTSSGASNLDLVSYGNAQNTDDLTLCFTYDGEFMRGYVNGGLSDSLAKTGEVTANVDGYRLGGAHVYTEKCNVFLYYTAIHNRALTSREVTSLHANPYQFLIPA